MRARYVFGGQEDGIQSIMNGLGLTNITFHHTLERCGYVVAQKPEGD